jgi:hypothetical protein
MQSKKSVHFVMKRSQTKSCPDYRRHAIASYCECWEVLGLGAANSAPDTAEGSPRPVYPVHWATGTDDKQVDIPRTHFEN